MFALVDVFFYWGINLFTGTAFANQLYPVLVHLPLILFFVLCYRYSLLSCCISVFPPICAVSSATGSGLSALTLTKNPVWYYSTRIAMTFITFFFLFKFVRRTTQTIFSKENKELVIIGFLPFIYYIFDYASTKFSNLCTPEIKSLLNLWDLLLVSAISFFCLYTLRIREEIGNPPVQRPNGNAANIASKRN